LRETSGARAVNITKEIKMSENKKITAQVTETGESDFAVSMNVSGHTIKGDEPEDAGGKNLGPAPYDLLTVAPR
jgi:hypothetical protein